MKLKDEIKRLNLPVRLDMCISTKTPSILRTTLHRIISHCWSHQKVPKCWKLDFTILIHKKDSPENPGNFNPIPFEPISAKVFTSLIRNRTYIFLIKNNNAEANIQKGFWSGVSGKVEHTETLTYLINRAQRYDRNLIVTLLDLRNAAFGEVDHDLIQAVLSLHHITRDIHNLIPELY